MILALVQQLDKGLYHFTTPGACHAFYLTFTAWHTTAYRDPDCAVCALNVEDFARSAIKLTFVFFEDSSLHRLRV